MHHHRLEWGIRLALWLLALAGVLLHCGLSISVAGAAEASVYRCTASDGRIEFRQFPCHERDDSLLLEINDQPSGWTPPDPAEVFKEKPEQQKSESAEQSESDARKDAEADRRWEEKCLKKQHQLAQVNRKLRAGYTASEGQRLREKRAEYEDYLKRLCD